MNKRIENGTVITVDGVAAIVIGRGHGQVIGTFIEGQCEGMTFRFDHADVVVVG